MKNRMLALLMAFVLCERAEAVDLVCPQNLSTEQTILATPKPWQSVKSQFSPILSGVGVYFGHPNEMTDLVPITPDKSSKEAAYSIWRFDKSQEYWIECRYDSTTLTLSMPLPKGLKACKVTYDESFSVAGNPGIKTIHCE